MKVLMFGWEFPPHISGGLGTACYGLTQGLSHIEDLDVTFVVPKAFGDEDQSAMNLIGANNVPIRHRKINVKDFAKKLDYIEVDSKLVPYVDPDEYYKLERLEVSSPHTFVQVNDHGCVNFTGKYGTDLLKEIADYAVVANVIAQDVEFDT